jgi:hypothetical protein
MQDIIQNTQDIRDKMLRLWEQVDQKKISATELRMHIGVARVILDTIKVEMAAAHLSQAQIPVVPVRPIHSIPKPAHGKRPFTTQA